jgi:hypothetical protein
LRLPDLRNVAGPFGLSGLVRDAGFGRGYRGDLYARCWALVYFLRKTRPREFDRYLDCLRRLEQCDNSPSGSRFETVFRTCFGDDLGKIESEWHTFMSAIQTPLEENAPPSNAP